MSGRRGRTFCWRLFLLCGMLAAGSLWPEPTSSGPRDAVVIAIDGAIGPATARYAVRSLRAAERAGAVVVILRVDTPGGLDAAMRNIIRAMLASPVPVIVYVGPSGARAASAGTYILYAAALAAMAPGTNLGAATPVSMFSPTPMPGPVPAPDRAESKKPPPDKDAELTKVTNDAVAYIRGLANLHARNADWAEQAVREAVSLPYDSALKEHVIDLVASDLSELLAKADGRSVIVQGKPVRLATTGLEIVQMEPGWSERLLGLLTDPSIVYLLLLAGVFGLAVEFTHPGIYAPGALGAICLLLGAYGLNLLPIDYAGLALVLLGLGLMTAEAFIPSFGAFVLGGLAAFVIGSLMMFEAPVARPSRIMIGGAALTSAALFGGVLTLLVRARRRPVVTGTDALIGLSGRTIAWVGNRGDVLVKGERWRARATSVLHPGQEVRVTGRDGLTLLVEPA